MSERLLVHGVREVVDQLHDYGQDVTECAQLVIALREIGDLVVNGVALVAGAAAVGEESEERDLRIEVEHRDLVEDRQLAIVQGVAECARLVVVLRESDDLEVVGAALVTGVAAGVQESEEPALRGQAGHRDQVEAAEANCKAEERHVRESDEMEKHQVVRVVVLPVEVVERDSEDDA